MEMHQVRYFLAVAEELNFTRAAERCFVSQPSMTRAIKALEDEFGGSLFHRERSRTHLTELGRMLLPHIQEIAQRAMETKRLADDFRTAERAKLKLGLMCTIAPGQLIELVRAVKIGHPGIELQILDATGDTLADRLDTGDLEVAIFCRPAGIASNHHNLPLYRERFVIAVSADHPLAQREAVRVRDLSGADYLDRIHCEQGEVASAIFKEQGIVDRTVYASDRDDWILAMAAAGLGYAFLPEQCAQYPGVVTRPLVEPEVWREVGLVTARGRPHSAPLGAFVREATKAFRKRPGTVLPETGPGPTSAPY